MRNKDDKDQSYLKDTAKVAPLFAAKAVLGDMPKAFIEKGVTAVAGGSGLRSAFKPNRVSGSPLRGAMGRGAGAVGGILTAVPFMRGLSSAKSDNAKERRRGLAMMAGSTVAFQGLKTMPEFIAQHGKAGVVKGLRSTAVRGLVKSPQAVALGMAIAHSQKKKDQGKSSGSLAPILTGTIGGAGTRALEGLAGNRSLRLSSLKKHVFPKAVGGAVGGAIAGLLLDKAIGIAKSKLKNN